MKGLNRNSENGLLEFFKREMGLCPPRNFSRRVSASETVIEHIDLYGELNGHEGCVNTVAFNSTGELLVSGSDDQKIMLWDWATKKLISSYPSGHLDNILRAKIMPFTDDRKIITSSADRQVRLIEVLENDSVESKKLSEHHDRVHSLAVEPGSPYIFYSCGEDGFVQHYDLRSCSATELFNCSSFEEVSWRIGLFSIVIDPRNPNYFAVGGGDTFARVYDVRRYEVNASTKEGYPVNIFCTHDLIESDDIFITSLAYSSTSELLVSYNDDTIHLFEKDMGVGGPIPFSAVSYDEQVYSGHKNSQTIKGVNFFGPNDEYVVSGSDCGHIFIWKKKGGGLVRSMVGDSEIVNQLEPHPLIPVLASCGTENNVKIWGPSSNFINPLPGNEPEIIEQWNLDSFTCAGRGDDREERENEDDRDREEAYLVGYSYSYSNFYPSDEDDGDSSGCNIG